MLVITELSVQIWELFFCMIFCCCCLFVLINKSSFLEENKHNQPTKQANKKLLDQHSPLLQANFIFFLNGFAIVFNESVQLGLITVSKYIYILLHTMNNRFLILFVCREAVYHKVQLGENKTIQKKPHCDKSNQLNRLITSNCFCLHIANSTTLSHRSLRAIYTLIHWNTLPEEDKVYISKTRSRKSALVLFC